MDLVWIFDIVLNFRTGFEDAETGTIVLDPMKAFKILLLFFARPFSAIIISYFFLADHKTSLNRSLLYTADHGSF